MKMSININKDCYMKGYKIQLFPTEEQKIFIDRCIELSRYIYNWTLELEINQYELWKLGKSDKKFLNFFDLCKLLSKERNNNTWLQYIPYNSAKGCMRRVLNAYERFFKGISNYPKFKNKKRCKKSFNTNSSRMYFIDNMLRIEGLPPGDKIHTKWNSGFDNKSNIIYYNPIISKDNLDKYYISFGILTSKELSYFINNNIPKSEVIGIDLNVRKRFVLSTGEIFIAPDINKYEKRKKRLQRKCHKDIKRLKQLQEITNPGQDISRSKRSNKRKEKLSKIYRKIYNINNTFHKTIVSKIVKRNPECIVIEDLDINNMLSKKYISKHISNIGLYNISVLFKQATEKLGVPLKIAPRNYKSSQICSRCGEERKTSNEIYICRKCGLRIDRHINAAINLAKLGY